MVEFRPTLTTFFDVLGFRDLVSRKEPAFIESVLRKLRKESKPESDLAEMLEISTIAFSDSIVRSTHLLSESNLQFPSGLLFHEVWNLAWIQGLLVYEDGIFLRGALTGEMLYLDDGIVFGPALINAYDIESKVACYPRIIVDDVVLKLLYENPKLLGATHHDIDDEISYLNSVTRIDFDGQRFVDYLSLDVGGPDPFGDLIEQHRKLVIQNAVEQRDNPRVLEKYHWAAAYHNTAVGEISDELLAELGFVREDLLLSGDEIPNFGGWANDPPVRPNAADTRSSAEEELS